MQRAHTQVGIDRMMEQSLQTNTYTQWYALLSTVVCFTYYLACEWRAVVDMLYFRARPRNHLGPTRHTVLTKAPFSTTISK